MADLRIPKRGKKIHSRGINYPPQDAKVPMPAKNMVYKKQPLGPVYLNDDPHSEWLEEIIGPARWLGYVDWGATRDAHSDEQVIRIHQPSVLVGWVQVKHRKN